MLKLFGYVTIRLVGTPFVEGRNIFEIVNIPILRSEYIRYPNPPLESHGWSAGVWSGLLRSHVTSLRSKCAQREISRKFSRSLTQVLISVTDTKCSRRRPFVGRTAQLSAAYRPQPHSPTACARAPSLVDRTAALLPQGNWRSTSKATPATLT